MDILKAIEILTKWREEGSVDNEEELHKAEQLGIEALTTVLAMRHYPFPDGIIKLPGETEE